MGESKDGKQSDTFAQRLEDLRRKNDEREVRLRNPSPRERVMFQVMGARTLNEIAEARKAMNEWVEEHPEDRDVFGRLGGDMGTMQAFIEHDEAREKLVGRAQSASTPAEISESRRLIGEWIGRFPQDAPEFAHANATMQEREKDIDS